MKVQGACYCGDITYEAIVDPKHVSICHCTDCQEFTGTAFRVTVPTLIEDFELRSGSPKVYIKTGDSGAKRAQAFCPRCGSPLYAHAVENPKTYGLRVGGIAQRRELVPTMQKWCDSALGWTGDIDNIPKRPRE
ncbi:MAG TPA: GFA family protein [Burkholderiaceae bacterium]|nr:GFA family protein [Burkholderiaceae bacterium]